MESSPVIVLDSDDDDEILVQNLTNPQENKYDKQSKLATKRSATITNGSEHQPKKIRRIQPVKIGEVNKSSRTIVHCQLHPSALSTDCLDNDNSGPVLNLDVFDKKSTMNVNYEIRQGESVMEPGPSTSSVASEITEKPEEGNELSPEMIKLIKVCRRAENSKEMKKIIETKLIKNYNCVHPDYITSKYFIKTVRQITEEIAETPHLVYNKLNMLIEELIARKNSKATVVTNESAVNGTGDEKKDEHLKKLYKALLSIKRHIDELEETEVNWDDDDDSAYIKKVRYEKRATEIYSKICDLTGESEHAHRSVKKPIKFKGTDLKEFNQKLQSIVNKSGSFPNYRLVLKCLDFCCKKYNYNITSEQMKRIAQDAFEKLGKTLQERRRSDLYESVTYYGKDHKDPAKDDAELRAKLEKNKKHYSKINEIIDQFADKEDHINSDTEEVSSTTLKIEGDPIAEIPSENGELDAILQSCDKELQEQILKTEITVDDEIII